MKPKLSLAPYLLLVGVAVAGCNDKVKVDPESTGATPAASTPAVSDTDSTEDTATTAPPAP